MKGKKYIRRAEANHNGILFYSNLYPGVITNVFYNSKGKIEKKIIAVEDWLIEKCIDDDSENDNTIIISAILMAIIGVLAIILSAILKNFMILFAVAYLFFKQTIIKYVYICSEGIKFKSKNGSKRKMGQFHSAEHMAIEAYEKKGRVPTLEEVKKTSRFSKKCGSISLFNNIFMDTSFFFFLIAISFIIKPVTYTIENYAIANNLILFGSYEPAICILTTLLMLLFSSLWFYISYAVVETGILRFFEVLFTNKPTDKELELAIEGVKSFEVSEQYLIRLQKYLNQKYENLKKWEA